MAATKRVCTATLIRGQVYSYRDPLNPGAEPVRFEYKKPKVVSKELADILEDLYDTIADGEGEEYDKPTFMVERNVPAPEDENVRKPRRLAADRPTKKRRARA